MLRISWVDRVTNETVSQRAGCGRELYRSIRQRQLRFVGHAMRQSQLESTCLTGKLEGKRGRGRPRIKFLDSLTTSIGRKFTQAELLQLTQDREKWRSMVDDAP